MPRLMTLDEVGDVLWRNPSIYARVMAHKALVITGEWEQITEANNWILPPELEGTFPIPPAGYTFSDERYGDVIIFPDAIGKLYFNVDVTQAQAAAVALPPFVSPTGNTISQVIADVKSVLASATALAGAIAVAIGLFILYRETR